MSNQAWLEVARAQDGVIALSQLAAGGLTQQEIRFLIRRHVFTRAGRGVFVLADRTDQPWRRRLWVAVLSAGRGAVAFRRSAATVWEFDGLQPGAPEVAVPPPRHPRHPEVHRVPLPAADIAQVGRMPITTAARTILDLATVLPPDLVEQALESGLRRQVVDLDELQTRADRLWVRGGVVLRQVLDRRPANAPPTESFPETVFVQIVRGMGLSDPKRQYGLKLRGERVRVDFAWPFVGVAVEIDGAATHTGSTALRRDLRRQNRIMTDGWLVLRFTWEDVVLDPAYVRAELRAAFEASRGLRRYVG